MQDDQTTTSTQSKSGKSKKSNGKWAKQNQNNDTDSQFTSMMASDDMSQDTQVTSQSTSGSPSSISGITQSLGLENVVDQARTAYGSVRDQARTTYDRVVSRGSDLVSNVDLSRSTSLIRSYPIQAAVGGLVIGFVLGAALTRRGQI